MQNTTTTVNNRAQLKQLDTQEKSSEGTKENFKKENEAQSRHNEKLVTCGGPHVFLSDLKKMRKQSSKEDNGKEKK